MYLYKLFSSRMDSLESPNLELVEAKVCSVNSVGLALDDWFSFSVPVARICSVYKDASLDEDGAMDKVDPVNEECPMSVDGPLYEDGPLEWIGGKISLPVACVLHGIGSLHEGDFVDGLGDTMFGVGWFIVCLRVT